MFESMSEIFDEKLLFETLSKMSDEDLEALEDDLDFCNFTGIPSTRVLEVLKDLTVLDSGWRRMLEQRPQSIAPTPY